MRPPAHEVNDALSARNVFCVARHPPPESPASLVFTGLSCFQSHQSRYKQLSNCPDCAEMTQRKYHLPDLDLLRSFEAVARQGSFTRAAEELSLTQSAVSRQIAQLEQSTNLKLFQRLHRRIEMTNEALALFGVVTQGLDAIQGCLASLQMAPDFPQITIATSVSFSYFWLMPRLEIFNRQHPEIDIRIIASDQRVDLRRQEADVFVLYGQDGAELLPLTPLFEEKVYPVCSPGFLASHQGLSALPDLLGKTLLHLDGGGNLWGAVDWPIWLESQGVVGKTARPGIRLNSYPMVIQAAESGRGIALGWSYIVDDLVACGRLLRPFKQALTTGQTYYLGASEEASKRPEVAAFIDWISSEVNQTRTPLA